jgi:hypothetical protein
LRYGGALPAYGIDDCLSVCLYGVNSKKYFAIPKSAKLGMYLRSAAHAEQRVVADPYSHDGRSRGLIASWAVIITEHDHDADVVFCGEGDAEPPPLSHVKDEPVVAEHPFPPLLVGGIVEGVHPHKYAVKAATISARVYINAIKPPNSALSTTRQVPIVDASKSRNAKKLTETYCEAGRTLTRFSEHRTK